MPDITVVAPEIVGFCVVVVKVFGPVQLYVTLGVDDEAVKFIELPTQTGVLLPAVGTLGELLTVATIAVLDAVVHPLLVAST